MYMKKIVSAISALAIAASTFAAMTITANAAVGDVTVNASADFTDAITDNKTGDLNIVSSNNDYPLEITDGWLYVGNGSASMTVSDAQLAGANDVVTVKLKVAYGKLNGNKYYYHNIADSKGTTIVSWKFYAYGGEIKENILGNGTDLPEKSEFYYAYNTPITGRAAEYTYTFDFAKDTVTLSTYNPYSKKTVTHTNPLPEGVNNVKTLTIGSTYTNNDRRCAVDDISISTTEGDNSVVYNTVDIKYVADGAEIGTEDLPMGTVTTETVLAGTEYTPVYPESFTTATDEYTFVSSDTEFPVTISEDKTITLTYTKRALADYTVTIKAAGDLDEIVKTYDVKEGKDLSYGYPMYIVKDGVAYEAEIPYGDDSYYSGSFTDVQENKEVVVTYNKQYENVIFSADLDDSSGDNAGIRASNGLAYNNKTYTSEETIEAGDYTFVIRAQNIGRGSTISVGDTTVFSYKDYFVDNEGNTTKGSWKTITFDVSLTEGGAIKFNQGPNKSTDDLDTILVIKKEEVTADSTYTFEGVLSELLDKTFKATATYNGKTATAEKPVSELIDTTDISDTSNVKFGIVITGVPETAVISNIVIE